MEDPRIDELMDCIDAVDEHGELTSIALIARRVTSYMEVVDQLKEELEELHSSTEQFEVRANNLSQSIETRETLRGDITDMAQTAVMRASLATTTRRGAELRKEAAAKNRDLQQFEKDFADEQRRLKETIRAMEVKQSNVVEIRQQISRRMNIIDALLQRAEVEWPSYFFDENDRIKAQQRGQSPEGLPMRKRRGRSRGRGRTTIIRRRKAS